MLTGDVDLFNTHNSSVNEWGIIRSACYAAVLTLATNKRIDRLVSTENFLQLAAVIDVRTLRSFIAGVE